MDIDPKPRDESPAFSEQPEPLNEPSFNRPQPTATPSPLIVGALDDEADEDKEPQTQPAPVLTPAPEKKSPKAIIIAILVIAMLGAAGGAWYVLAGPGMTKTTTTDTTTETTTQTTPPATSSTVEDAGDALTASAIEEATTAATDDSATATDDSTAAGNVGDSINENTF